nr:CRISPR-associated endonuclease Cas2 [Candidatus Cyanaurora vandensis]
MLWIIAYDIPLTKRRTKIAELLEGYGQRVQYSVFECDIEEQKFKELRERLQKLCKLPEDSVRFYPVNLRSTVVVWGGEPPLEARTHYTI